MSDEIESAFDAYCAERKRLLIEAGERIAAANMQRSPMDFRAGWEAALASRAVVPSVAVPDEPTMEMREAGNRALDMLKAEPGMGIADRAYYVYRAMLAAAPAPQPGAEARVSVPLDALRWLMGMGRDGFVWPNSERERFGWRSEFLRRAGLDIHAIAKGGEEA